VLVSQELEVEPVFVDQELEDPDDETSSQFFIFIDFILKFVRLFFSKILKFKLKIPDQKVTVFGLHLFSSQVINQKNVSHK